MYWVYILKNLREGKYYVGYTMNLGERIRQHNRGKSRWTKNKGGWVLVYSEHYRHKSEAISRENEIKRKKSRQYIEYLVRQGDVA